MRSHLERLAHEIYDLAGDDNLTSEKLSEFCRSIEQDLGNPDSDVDQSDLHYFVPLAEVLELIEEASDARDFPHLIPYDDWETTHDQMRALGRALEASRGASNPRIASGGLSIRMTDLRRARAAINTRVRRRIKEMRLNPERGLLHRLKESGKSLMAVGVKRVVEAIAVFLVGFLLGRFLPV